MIEIYLLEALCALNEYGTLSAAAEHLHISQPALSRSMQKLEDILGVSLFERTKNKIQLNDTGKMAASFAARILDSEEDMIRAIRNYDSSLHTISGGYCAPGPMMEMPLSLSRMFPKTALSSDIEEEEALLKGLRNEKYTFIVLSDPIDDKDMICLPCGKETLYFSLIPAHPAALYKDQGLSFADMNGETFVMASEVGIWYELTRKMMPDSRLVLQNNLESLNAVINASTLPAFATDLTIRLFRSEENANRIFIKVKDPEASISYYCVFLKKNAQRLKAWTNHLKERYSLL